MKRTFADTVYRLMHKHDNIYLFTGDLGFGILDKIQEIFPERFINVGICEQNMTSMAAGMSLEGNIVFTYSIGNFPTMRCLEQIRNDIAYHHANVKIIAVGGGFAYGQLGMSHHATEDIAIMRAIPGLTIFVPADCAETEEVIKEAVKIKGPVYIRLGHGGEPDIYHENLEVNHPMCVCHAGDIVKGKRITLLGTGTIMPEVEKAAHLLQNKYTVAAYSVAKLKPIDVQDVKGICENSDYVVSVEEHNIIGGLGSMVAEVIAEHRLDCRLIRIGMKDSFTEIVGSVSYLRSYYGIDCGGICKCIQQRVER